MGGIKNESIYRPFQSYNAPHMSYLAEQDVVCTNCKHPNNAEIWSSINTQVDPELKDILLGGELNLIECAACRKVFYAEQFLLYHDPANELMAFVYPFSHREEKEAWEEKTKMDFSQSDYTYPAVSLFGLDELVRLVEAEDEAEIQSEIVAHMAPDDNLAIKRLRPSVARRYSAPRVIPYVKTPSTSRENLLAALGKIQEKNDRLSVYVAFATHVKITPDLNCDFPE